MQQQQTTKITHQLHIAQRTGECKKKFSFLNPPAHALYDFLALARASVQHKYDSFSHGLHMCVGRDVCVCAAAHRRAALSAKRERKEKFFSVLFAGRCVLTCLAGPRAVLAVFAFWWRTRKHTKHTHTGTQSSRGYMWMCMRCVACTCVRLPA